MNQFSSFYEENKSTCLCPPEDLLRFWWSAAHRATGGNRKQILWGEVKNLSLWRRNGKFRWMWRCNLYKQQCCSTRENSTSIIFLPSFTTRLQFSFKKLSKCIQEDVFLKRTKILRSRLHRSKTYGFTSTQLFFTIFNNIWDDWVIRSTQIKWRKNTFHFWFLVLKFLQCCKYMYVPENTCIADSVGQLLWTSSYFFFFL